MWPLGPFSVNQSGEVDMVEAAEPRAFGVDDVHTAVAGSRCKGAGLDPPADQRRNLVEFDGARIEPGMRIAQCGERPDDRGAAPQLPGTEGIVRSRKIVVSCQKADEHAQAVGDGTRGA